MRKYVLEVRLEEDSIGSVCLMADVGRGIRPSVVILENCVAHRKEQGLEDIQLLSVFISSPIAESLRVNGRRFSEFGGIMGSHHGQ